MGKQTVVIGAGSSGAALAARLSEDPGQDVILLEAGPDYATAEAVPASVLNAYDIAEDHDWGLTGYFVEPPEERVEMPYPRGRLVGGSSCVNASIAQRGAPEDFERWVSLGNEGWSWPEVEPAFRRLERDLDYGELPHHGADGPVSIYRIGRDRWPAGVSAFEQACLDRGFPAWSDANAPYGTGVGPLPRNQIGDHRASALLTYLAGARDRPNLTIQPDTRVHRIVFEGRRAVGVEVMQDGRLTQLEADRIVLSAGSIFSPQILMLSGIGPAQTLQELGVEPLIALEGVGKNLRDHPILMTFGLLKHHGEGERYGCLNTCRYTSGPGEHNDMVLFSPVLEPSALNLDLDIGDRKAMGVLSLLAKPRSVGWLSLTSVDPNVNPELHLNFLSDRSDVTRLKAGIRLSWEIANSSPVADELSEILFPDAETIEDDDRLEAWMRANVSTGYHASGTCRMGTAADPGAVVAPNLSVHGAENLWVADASIMPIITTGLTNLTAYMIGERMADILRDEGPGSTPVLAGARGAT
jgi:choline dehydrogenase